MCVSQWSTLCSSVVLLCLLCSSASSQSVRTGFIRGEVLLPCIYSEKLSEPVTTFWRDKDDKVVLDIINSREDKIDAKFTGRVFSFPDQYKTGNLSILIKGLRADDGGPYDCNIPKVDYQTKITLNVTVKPAVKITTPHPEPPTTRGAAVTTSKHHLSLLSAPLFVLFSSLNSTTAPNIQPKSLRTIFSMKKNKKYWYSPHRAQISTSSSVSGIEETEGCEEAYIHRRSVVSFPRCLEQPTSLVPSATMYLEELMGGHIKY